MERATNEALAAWLREHKVTRAELAESVNDALAERTGRRGNVTERSVFRWLSGEIRWPQSRQREAIQMVTGVAADNLGFVPRGRRDCREDDMHRRTLLAATSGVALSRCAKVGMSDVERLRDQVDGLAELDDEHGGSRDLEEAAILRAGQAHELLQRTVSSARVRGALYALAADATTTAAWAAIDTHGAARASAHLNKALALAGMSRDADAELRAWHNISMLATQEGRSADALAAAEAARSSRAARGDSLYASLAHARTASCHARTPSRQAVLRSLGYAEQALSRADADRPRPSWMRFYDAAELHGLAAVFYSRLGQPDVAEYRAHHALAQLRPELVRNRIYYTAQLALTQIQQRDVRRACATADQALNLSGGTVASARIRTLLMQFRTQLQATAPYEPDAREWLERTAPHPR
jgi:hypothetical protein